LAGQGIDDLGGDGQVGCAAGIGILGGIGLVRCSACIGALGDDGLARCSACVGALGGIGLAGCSVGMDGRGSVAQAGCAGGIGLPPSSGTKGNVTWRPASDGDTVGRMTGAADFGASSDMAICNPLPCAGAGTGAVAVRW
jgi:hypothetical protein